MKDKEKQQCVICHKDITSELPKIDIYGNHYCKDCYIEKCKYEFMNMRDTILINKELLKRELQFLEEQIKQARKETAEKIIRETIDKLIARKAIVKSFYSISESVGVDMAIDEVKKLAKQFGLEIKE